jgi:hypothetical protein
MFRSWAIACAVLASGCGTGNPNTSAMGASAAPPAAASTSASVSDSTSRIPAANEGGKIPCKDARLASCPPQ